jgi:hypothetical protein
MTETIAAYRRACRSYTAGVRDALGVTPLGIRRLPEIAKTRPELYMFYIGLLAMMSVTAVLI